MNTTSRQRVLAAWSEQIEDILHPPATDEQIEQFEREFGPIPADYRWFLQVCGGGVVGSEWVDNIHQLIATHAKFRAESIPEDGWSMKDVFIVGWDGGGNPFGIDARTGKVLVEDHTFGGIHEMAPSFEHLLLAGIPGA